MSFVTQFVEALEEADAVDVDSTHFVRYFNYINEEDEKCLEISVITDDFNELTWMWHDEDLEKAEWNNDKQCWIMHDGTELRFYKFSPIMPECLTS